jgi:hypothetical protein
MRYIIDYNDLFVVSVDMYPKGSPKFNLMQSKIVVRKVMKKPSPIASKRGTSPRGILTNMACFCSI